ncbi:unnamed protein product [Lactuca virosa]|uniref:Uncharacterized protein n=1 Tax=Lactuca virosa TaxID=75947 RepID=A0AAU9MUD2_9ASTR|nr:unnamed protein product [Lactuca virosa]
MRGYRCIFVASQRSKRKGNCDLAMAKLKEGNINVATEMFQRAVSITPSMAHQLIEILKLENIEFSSSIRGRCTVGIFIQS